METQRTGQATPQEHNNPWHPAVEGPLRADEVVFGGAKLTDYEKSFLAPPKRVPGGLVVEGFAAKVGVLEYPGGRREYRGPDVLFNQHRLDQYEGLHLAKHHPPGKTVQSPAADLYTVGTVLQPGQPVKELGRVKVRFVVHRTDAQEAVLSGELTELSLGYRVRVQEQPGVFVGETYTHRVLDYEPDHLALTDRARAGRDTQVRVDENKRDDNDKTSRRSTVKVRVGDVTFEVEDENGARAVENLKVRCDEADAKAEEAAKAKGDEAKRADTLEAERDQLKAENEKLKAKLAELEGSRNDEDEEAHLNLVVRLQPFVKDFDLKALVRADSRSLKETVLLQSTDLDEETLKSKSDDYVDARFDSVLESLESGDQERQQGRENLGRQRQATFDQKKKKVAGLRGDSAHKEHLLYTDAS